MQLSQLRKQYTPQECIKMLDQFIDKMPLIRDRFDVDFIILMKIDQHNVIDNIWPMFKMRIFTGAIAHPEFNVFDIKVGISDNDLTQDFMRAMNDAVFSVFKLKPTSIKTNEYCIRKHDNNRIH